PTSTQFFLNCSAPTATRKEKYASSAWHFPACATAWNSSTFSRPTAAKNSTASPKPPTASATGSVSARCSSEALSAATTLSSLPPHHSCLDNVLYCRLMSSSAPSQSKPDTPRPSRKQRIQSFWQRVSEGQDIDDLWSQFAADTRSSYGFYGKDVDWEEVNKLPRWKRPFHVTRQLFWAMMNKLTPARRVLLLLAIVLLLISAMNVESAGQLEFVSAVLFLLLLSLELADKVTMKRDLEI